MPEVPVLQYANPQSRRFVGWSFLLPRFLLLLSVGCASYVFFSVISLAQLWSREAGSGCGVGRMAVRAGLAWDLILLVVAASTYFAGRRLAPGTATISKLARIAAATAWATLWIWFGFQRDFRLWL